MSVKIQLRRDVSSVWTSRNPILALGEPGFETNTHKLKIGDGTTAWNSLDYVSDGFSGVGGPLDYTYAVSYGDNTFLPNDPNIITNLRINPISHDIDFSPYYDDLISNSYAINMTLTQVEDADKAILFKCNNIVDLTSVPPHLYPYYSFDVTELSRSASFTGFEYQKKYYLNIDIKGASGIFQIASVDLHNGGIQTAQVLQFDNNTLQSVITGPTPPSGDSAKRIIVQGQRAEGGGEGGDVYVWGGDSDANGGDIKIYAGDADNVSPDSGNGGYVNIDGGAGATNGGDVEITAGYSEGGSAGDVIIAGGSTSSGVAGTVNINANYGSWVFSPDTSLTLPHGGIITDSVETVTLSGAGTVEVNQTYRLIAVGSYGGIWIGTTDNYQIETKPAPSTGYLVRLSTVNPPTGYYESEDLITWTIVSGEGGGVSPVPTGVIVPPNVTLMPPTALAGQSLVIRGTSPTGITSDHPGGFAAGDIITITVTPDNGNAVTGTVDYTFTGNFGVGELGTATTGTLTFNYISSVTVSWTVPAESSMTTFTFTLSNSSGIGLGGLTALTLTRTGSSEDSHIHLISGDPTTVDIYLGDDDQYIKIEKNAGDVVIGTNSDTNHWTFGTDGSLTLPQGGIIDEALSVETLTLVGAALADVNQTYIKTSPTLYTGSNGVTIEAIGDGIWFCIQGGDTKYSSTDNLITWDNSTGGLPVPTSTVNLGVDTVNITVGTETWTFGQDGMLTFPGGDISIGTMTQYGQATPAIIASPDMSIGMVTSGASGSVALQWFDDIDNITNGAGVVVNPYNNTGTVQIMSSSGQWTFGANALTFPDSTTQTTACVPSSLGPALTSIAGLTTASDNYIYTTASNVYTTGTITDFGRSLVDDTNASDARSTLELVIGSDVQEYDAQLTDIAGLSPTDNSVIIGDGNNFVLESGDTLRTSLGLAIGSDVQEYDATLAAVADGTYTGTNTITSVGTLTSLATSDTSVTLTGASTLISTTTNAADLTLATNGNVSSASILIASSSTNTGNINLQAGTNGGNVNLVSDNIVVGTGSAQANIVSTGAYNLFLAANGTAGANITIDGTAPDANININAIGTGAVFINTTKIILGKQNSASDPQELSYANGSFSSDGDARFSSYVLMRTTNYGGWNSLYLNYPTNTDSDITVNSTTATFSIHISARNSNNNDSAGFIVRGCVKQTGSASLSLVGSPVIESFLDTNFSTANVQILTGGSGLTIQVDQGSYNFGSTTTYWIANVQMSRVNF